VSEITPYWYGMQAYDVHHEQTLAFAKKEVGRVAKVPTKAGTKSNGGRHHELAELKVWISYSCKRCHRQRLV
jgi:hypothetical protein